MNQPMTSTTEHHNEELIERLAYAGGLPFVLLAILLWLVDEELHPFVSIALAAYGAVIVSFLGGIHWGIAFIKNTKYQRLHLIWGITLSMLACLAVLMLRAILF